MCVVGAVVFSSCAYIVCLAVWFTLDERDKRHDRHLDQRVRIAYRGYVGDLTSSLFNAGLVDDPIIICKIFLWGFS